jgi:hypothetical protein
LIFTTTGKLVTIKITFVACDTVHRVLAFNGNNTAHARSMVIAARISLEDVPVQYNE